MGKIIKSTRKSRLDYHAILAVLDYKYCISSDIAPFHFASAGVGAY